MTVNNSKSYLAYSNKLVDEYKNTYHRSTGTKLIDFDYSALTEEIETNPESPIFKVSESFRITKCKNIFSKGYTVNWSKEIFVITSALKTNPWTYNIKDLN